MEQSLTYSSDRKMSPYLKTRSNGLYFKPDHPQRVALSREQIRGWLQYVIHINAEGFKNYLQTPKFINYLQTLQP